MLGHRQRPEKLQRLQSVSSVGVIKPTNTALPFKQSQHCLIDLTAAEKTDTEGLATLSQASTTWSQSTTGLDQSQRSKAMTHDTHTETGVGIPIAAVAVTTTPVGPSQRLTSYLGKAENKKLDQGTTHRSKKGTSSTTGLTTSKQARGLGVQKEEEKDPQKAATQGFNYVEGNDGGHFIRTPGGRYWNINQFIMKIEKDAYDRNQLVCPARSNAVLYDGSRYVDWIKLENQIPELTYLQALKEDCPLERFRRFTLMSLVRFFTKIDGRASTIHYAATNLNRVIAAYQTKGVTITMTVYAGVAMACIRMAIKHEDTVYFNRLWQNPIRQLWEKAGFGAEINNATTLQKINEIECSAVKLLQHPMLTPPSPLDFLDRYLSVGGWPQELMEMYRDLAHYIIDLSLFAPHMSGLIGARPSLLAAAALVLSVKIHNQTGSYVRYEFWPHRLEVLTNYSMGALNQVIRELSSLIRNKPQGEELLAVYHKVWGAAKWASQ